MFPKRKILWSPATLHSPHTHHFILSPPLCKSTNARWMRKRNVKWWHLVSDASSTHVSSEWAGLAEFNPQIRRAALWELCQHVVFQWGPVKMKQITTSYVLGNATWKQSSVERRWTSRFRVISNKFSIFAPLTLFTCFSEAVALLPTAEKVDSHYLYYWKPPALMGRSRQGLPCTNMQVWPVRPRKEEDSKGSKSTGSIASHSNFFYFLLLDTNKNSYLPL